MSGDQGEAKYTKPSLRRRIKTDLQKSAKGGRPGRWSARKSQLLVREYERQGGGYVGDANRDEAASLREWTAQDWQTRDGSARARSGRTTKRYLPKRAWGLLGDDEKRRTEAEKRRGSAEGEPAVPNTAAAKAARAYVDHGDAHGLREVQLKRLTKQELLSIARTEDLPGRSKMNKAQLARTLHKHFRTAS